MDYNHIPSFGSSADQPNTPSPGSKPDASFAQIDAWISCTTGYSPAEIGQTGVTWAAMRLRHLFERTPNRADTEVVRSHDCCVMEDGRALLSILQLGNDIVICLDLKRVEFLAPLLVVYGMAPLSGPKLRSPSGEKIAVFAAKVPPEVSPNDLYEALRHFLDRDVSDLRSHCIELAERN